MSDLNKSFGEHYLVEFIDCDEESIKFVDSIQSSFMQAAQKSGAVILQEYYHQFEPYGVTGIILIAESHFSIHTWPDDQYVAFDVLTCGSMDPVIAIQDLTRSFKAQRVETKVITRGF